MSNSTLFDARLYHPSTMLVCGPSGSGKSYFTKSLIESSEVLFQPTSPKFVILIYDVWQDLYEYFVEKNLVHLTVKGLDDFQYIKEVLLEKKNLGGTLHLIDDQAPRIDQNIVDIFTIYSHDLIVTCVLLTQSIFDSNKEYRTISLNSHYIILMKNTRGASSITNLAKQTHPYRYENFDHNYALVYGMLIMF